MQDLSLSQTIEILDMGHITDITAATGTIYVAGFIMPAIPSRSEIQDIDRLSPKPYFTILRNEPFYKPHLAFIPSGHSGPVLAICPVDASSTDELALPLSVICVAPR